ncbi:cytidylate kinase family protein [Microgenomates group bacterium]|nr:cytidylate kinase family protein [Microgenomates group bacterium]
MPKYINVAISGLPGCGSTTLLGGLKSRLQFHGWTGFSGGAFMRAYAIEQGFFNGNSTEHHNVEAYPDDFDRQVDYDIRHKLQTQEKWIIESWLAGFFSQGIKNTLKVLMTCSDVSVRIDRVVNRDGLSVQDAKRNMASRHKTNLKSWSKMYAKEWQEFVVDRGILPASAPIDFWHPALYDLVIDTYSTNRKECLDLVIETLGMKDDLV